LKGWFTFGELKSNNIEKLYINYKTNKINEYKYKLNDDIDKYNVNEDINLNLNFSKLEEIYIKNVSEEKNIYKKVLNINKNSKIKFNFIYQENKSKIRSKNENINDEYEYEGEEEDIYKEKKI